MKDRTRATLHLNSKNFLKVQTAFNFHRVVCNFLKNSRSIIVYCGVHKDKKLACRTHRKYTARLISAVARVIKVGGHTSAEGASR